MADQTLYVDNELGNNANPGTSPGASAKANLFSAVAALNTHAGNHKIWVKKRSTGTWTGETTYCNFANLIEGATVVVEGYKSTTGDTPSGTDRPDIVFDPNWDALRDASTTTDKSATFKNLILEYISAVNNYFLAYTGAASGLNLAFTNCKLRRDSATGTTLVQLLRTSATPKTFVFTDCYFDGTTTTNAFQFDVRASTQLRFIRCYFDSPTSSAAEIVSLGGGTGTHALVEFNGCTGQFQNLVSNPGSAFVTKVLFLNNTWAVTRGPVFSFTKGTADLDTIRFARFEGNVITLSGDLTSLNVIGVGLTAEDSTPTYRPVLHFINNRVIHDGVVAQTTSGAHMLFVGHNCGGVRIERNVIVDFRTAGASYGVVCKGLGGGVIKNNAICASYGLYLVGCHAFTVENNVIMTNTGTPGEKACVAFGITAAGSYAPYGCVIRRNILCGLGRADSVGIKSQFASINPNVIHAVCDENIYYNLTYLSNLQTAGPTDNFTTTLSGLQGTWVSQAVLCATFGNDTNSTIADPLVRNWSGTTLADFGINSWGSPAAPDISSRYDNGYGCLRPRWKRHGTPKSIVING